MNINDMFERVYYINLANRPDRRQHIESELQRVGVSAERWEAVDGISRDLSENGISSPAVACRQSHNAILNQCLNDGIDSVLILEDDAVFHPEFQSRLDSFTLPDNWKMILFGYNYIVAHEYQITPGLNSITGALSAHAIGLMGRDLITHLAMLTTRGREVDITYADAMFLYNAIGFNPPLVKQLPGRSDIVGVEVNYDYEHGVFN